MKKFVLILAGIICLAAFSSFTSNSSSSLTSIEQLGKNIFFDKISAPDNMSCADCHAPGVGFTGPIPAINKHGAVYRGAVPQRFGNRKPPSAAYATLSPIFHFDAVEGLFIGGNFWDGRATGEHLGNPAADQALGPFLNPVEQNNADKLSVLMQIAASNYAYLWLEVWGVPLFYSTPEEINENYNRVGLAIAAYEASVEVNPFTSKYDYFLAGKVQLTPQELLGKDLFEGQGLCAECHMYPNFTDFTFDNLGVPKNPENPFYEMDEVFLPDGSPINPLGDAWIDKGLGGFLETRPEYSSMAAENMGKHKVPTLRNVDLRLGNGFTKAYMHNGVFKSLKEVVHFYNTRDVEVWPAPEVPENINVDELGNLGLSDAQEDAIVAFMKTLSDGYKLPKSGYTQSDVAEAISLNIVNPVTFTTQVDFNIPVASDVKIEIYNAAGNRVQSLVNGSYQAGEHFVMFSPGNLSSGMYIIRLSAAGQVIVKKTMIVR